MPSNYEYVKRWRHKVKRLLVGAFGGVCALCGYDRCVAALDFHHLDENSKEFSIASWSRNSMPALVAEAKKCVMLCSNCHREVHHGLVSIPDDATRFDPQKFQAGVDAAREKRKRVTPRTTKLRSKNSCRRGNWESVDVVSLRQGGASWEAIGRMAGVTGVAAKKRFKKIQGV